MYLKIQILNKMILEESEKYFGVSFCDNLKYEKSGTYEESLVARYLIKKELQIRKKNGGQDDFHSSISHKKELVFIGVGNKKIGVDIEVFKIRDENILDSFSQCEYEVLGGKNWENFYILWTAKESIIKYIFANLDDISEIILEQKIDNEIQIGDIRFKNKLGFIFKGNKYNVISGNRGDYYFSICH